MSGNELKAAGAWFLVFVAAGLMPASLAKAASHSKALASVRGVTIHDTSAGAVIIDIAATQPVAYRTFQLSGPERLVVDLKGARKAISRRVYPAESQLLRRVRVGQWRSDPPIVRVVADLNGTPAFSVHARASGIRIELESRATASSPVRRSRSYHAHHERNAPRLHAETDPRDEAPKSLFAVHRFEDLTASLTAPALPPHDRLIRVTRQHSSSSEQNESAILSLVSGISIKPESNGETYIDIASSRSVPYRVFQLPDPFRLVVDLKDARDASRRGVYPVDSSVLRAVRVAQWRSRNPAVVRVVADLEGYPIFDIHAQRPGIRIELRPNLELGPLIRNPFEFATQRRAPPRRHSAPQMNQAMTAATNSTANPPGTAFSDLKVMGYIVRQDSEIQAIISDRTNIYSVPQGGTIENTFRVISISANAVEVQDVHTLKTTWLAYAP